MNQKEVELRLKAVEERLNAHRLRYRNRGHVLLSDLETEKRLLRQYRELQNLTQGCDDTRLKDISDGKRKLWRIDCKRV
jgi:hypothetical protein